MATKKKTAKKTTTPADQLVVVGGQSGVYVGWLAGGCASIHATTETCTLHLRNARHLRRYTVMGKKTDGTLSDLAALGLDPASSPSTAVIGVTALLGVRRACDVAPAAVASFGVPS
jgi:hypothetical protein